MARRSSADAVRPSSGLNKHERTYATLRKRIFDGTYGPGYRLVLDALARELAVSPVPVREAVRRLEAEGLVVYRRNAGAQVAPVDPRRWEEEMTVLAVLEGFATAEAASEIASEDIARLRELNDAMAQALRSPDVLLFSKLNKEFHFVTYARSSNTYLRELLQETWDRLDMLRRTVFTYIPTRGWASVEEHEQLIEMLEQGSPADEIEAFARTHKLRTIDAYRSGNESVLAVSGGGGGTG